MRRLLPSPPHQSRHTMAETLDYTTTRATEPLMLPDEPHLQSASGKSGKSGSGLGLGLGDETDAREATELARLRQNYSRASSYSHHRPGPGSISRKPATALGRFTYSLSRFWRHQVSIVVPHASCRDHLGMEFYLCPVVLLHKSIFPIKN